jgi:hypothetical protein
VRSSQRTCARCRTASLDVGGAGGWSVLAGRWRSYPAFARGRALWSPLGAHRLPVVAGLAVAVAVGAAAAPIAAALTRRSADPAEVALAAAVGLICAPLVAMLIGAFLVFYANVCRVLAALTSFIPTPLGFGRARVNLAAAIFDWIAKVLLLPIIVGSDPESTGPREQGTLLEPLTVHLRRDSLSFAERFDAWLDGPLTVRIGDATRRIDFVSGELTLDPRCGERQPDATAPPPWADAPGRPGVGRLAVIPAGTRVTLAAGRLALSGP